MDEIKEIKRFIIWGVILSVVIGAILSTCTTVWNTSKKATHIDDAVQVYEEFEEIYNTCSKINTDLCNIRDLSADDKMFEQFNKSQRIIALQTNLNRWIYDYNAKSKMWGRNLWKSKKLPYELSIKDFSCYNK